MTWKVLELLITDYQLASKLQDTLDSLTSDGYTVYSIETTFSSMIVIANKKSELRQAEEFYK